MTFIHEDHDFQDLIQIVAQDRQLAPGLVEKDYWVTHTLWALHAVGFEVWFKGGTSLSKGFGLIQRFSEDLDLKIEPGTVAELPTVSDWEKESTKAKNERRAYFEKLPTFLLVPGAVVALDPDKVDSKWRGADIRVTYPGQHLADLGVMMPFVRLEVGNARVTPFAPRDMSSFVHDKLATQGQLGGFKDNCPRGVRCVHPLVTLLEKFDAISRRFKNEKYAPATFVRHVEDAAQIIAAESRLPPMSGYPDVRALADDMTAKKQIVAMLTSQDPAFVPGGGERWASLRAAHTAIAPMFWGPRISLDDACETIRGWIANSLG